MPLVEISDIPTVKIPELPDYAVYGDLTIDDLVVMYLSAWNKTTRVPLTVLRNWILTGGGLSHAPIITGNAMLVKVSAVEADGKIFSIPSIAGRDFILRRGAIGAMDLDTYEILDAGGFQLTRDDDVLNLNETFEIQFYGSGVDTGGAIPGTAGAGGSSLITGVKTVATNTILVSSDLGKLIQVRGNDTLITITLPDITTIPQNVIIPIETNINQNTQVTITTASGQFIYFRSTALTSLYMGVSESIDLFRGEDGYYVKNPSGNFLSVGDVVYKHKAGLNEIIAQGQLLQRLEYPRLFEYAESSDFGIVDDSTWLSVTGGIQEHRGCFSHGDGLLTFRVPNLLDAVPRALANLSGTSADPLRPYNRPGGFQKDRVGSMENVSLTHGKGFAYTGGPNNTTFGNGDPTNGHGEPKTATVSIDTGNPETTVKSIAFLPIIKC